MPKPSRSSRSRPRTRRPLAAPPASASPTAEALPPPVESRTESVPAAAPRAARRTPAGLSAAVSQRYATDYAYVISELKRIFVISGVIIALMLALWLFIR